ncbi:MAG TPA: histidine phosphatase family protein [Vicinamibacterales bacterium]|nr:histidine phosphatase family protein [Vicinamibacterales bacterium]
MPRTVVLPTSAQTDAVGDRLSGRIEFRSIRWDAQAERLRARLTTTDIAAMHHSPLQRVIETAHTLAGERNLRIEPSLELQEVDFGEWSGERFEALARDPRCRGSTRCARCRPRREAKGRSRLKPGSSGRYVIRLAILYTAGAPIDFIHRFDILPASVTAIALERTVEKIARRERSAACLEDKLSIQPSTDEDAKTRELTEQTDIYDLLDHLRPQNRW